MNSLLDISSCIRPTVIPRDFASIISKFDAGIGEHLLHGRFARILQHSRQLTDTFGDRVELGADRGFLPGFDLLGGHLRGDQTQRHRHLLYRGRALLRLDVQHLMARQAPDVHLDGSLVAFDHDEVFRESRRGPGRPFRGERVGARQRDGFGVLQVGHADAPMITTSYVTDVEPAEFRAVSRSPVAAVTTAPVASGAAHMNVPPGRTTTPSPRAMNRPGTPLVPAELKWTLLVFAAAADTKTILMRANVCVSPRPLTRTPARSRFSVAEAVRVRVSCHIMSAWFDPVPEVRVVRFA